jgi:cell division septation protein DedD
MYDLLIGSAILVALAVIGLLAIEFGVDSRQPPDTWW